MLPQVALLNASMTKRAGNVSVAPLSPPRPLLFGIGRFVGTRGAFAGASKDRTAASCDCGTYGDLATAAKLG